MLGRRYTSVSVPAGPFRLNVSRRGLGWSVGAKRLRTGTSAAGRSFTTFRVPGTSISVAKRGGFPMRCLGVLAVVGAIGAAAGEVALFIASRGTT